VWDEKRKVDQRKRFWGGGRKVMSGTLVFSFSGELLPALVRRFKGLLERRKVF